MAYAEDWDERHKPVKSKEEYLELFRDAEKYSASGEVSPLYLYHTEAAKRIKAECPNAKLVAVLRNPADRAFSAWLHMKRDGKESLGFEDALKAEQERARSGRYHPGFLYRSLGFYGELLRSYRDEFPASQVMLVRYEEFNRDNAEVLKRLSTFLGVDPNFVFPTKLRMNVSGIPKRKWLHRWLNEELPKSRLFHILKLPFPEPMWFRMVKGVQHWNLERPTLAEATRRDLMHGYEEDLRRLEEDWGFDVTAWRAAS
jgi:hypothetical protein